MTAIRFASTVTPPSAALDPAAAAPVATAKNYMIAQLDQVPAVPCPCGHSRRGFATPDNKLATIHLVDISIDAKTHYHKRMTEIYLVLEGEGFMERYDPLEMKGPRYKLVQGVLGELKANRGPVYVDCRHIDPPSLEHLITTLSYDKDTFADFLHQKGLDLRKDLLEVAPSEGMQGWPNELCGSGIKIDADCATNIPGLFAAGNSADQCRSLHMAVSSGIHAGRTSSVYGAGKKEKDLVFPKKQIEELREQTFAPRHRTGSISWQEFEDVLQRTLTEGMGPVRSAWGMEKAWKNLGQLEIWKEQVLAGTYHDLCRTHEVFNMLTVARCMIKAALYRKESRFGQCHCRQDYPQTDDQNWLGLVTVNRGIDGLPQPGFSPLRYE